MRVGFPLVFWEEGGFAYRANLNGSALIADLVIGLIFSAALGALASGRVQKTS